MRDFILFFAYRLSEIAYEVFIKHDAFGQRVDAYSFVITVARSHLLESYEERSESQSGFANGLHISAIRAAGNQIRRKHGIAVSFVYRVDGVLITFRFRIGDGTCVAGVENFDFYFVFRGDFFKFFKTSADRRA